MNPAELYRPECFALRRGEIKTRFDPKYIFFNELISSRFSLRPLGSLVRVEPDYGSGARAIERRSQTDPRYIRITDFGEDGIPEAHEYVTADPIEIECELYSNDLLFARSGATVGKTYIHENNSEPAIFAGYCIRFRFDEKIANPHYVYWCTKTAFYGRWVKSIQRPSGQPNINKEEFKSFIIPLPDRKTQDKLVARMDVAREERRRKLRNADVLISSLDGFLLDNLGLNSPPPDNRRVFAVRLKAPRTEGRLNSDYFHPERIQDLRELSTAASKLAVHCLAEVVDFERNQIKEPGENYLSLAHVQSHTGELTNAVEQASGACFTFQKADVLFARLRPYLNKVYLAEMDGCCSPEFHVLRVKNREALLPDYLAAILRSQLTLSQTVHMMTGNTHPRLANEDVVNLKIPIPELKVQAIIASEVHRRRREARRLLAEAESGWQDAKRWFEEQLLGRGQSYDL